MNISSKGLIQNLSRRIRMFGQSSSFRFPAFPSKEIAILHRTSLRYQSCLFPRIQIKRQCQRARFSRTLIAAFVPSNLFVKEAVSSLPLNFSGVTRRLQQTGRDLISFLSSRTFLENVLRRRGVDEELGFGFSAGGLLFPYLIGVATELQKERFITPNTKLAGASAGSLIAACVHSGLSEDEMMDASLKIARDCRKFGTKGRLKKNLEGVMQEMLPSDAHLKCSDKIYIAITQVYPFKSSGDYLISNFTSRDDLIQTLLTSCHIPWWFDNTPITNFRDTKCVDGGLTNLMPVPPVRRPVRVSCFPVKGWGEDFNAKIAPDTYRPSPVPINKFVSWALEPADDMTLYRLRDMGKEDAKEFIKDFDAGEFEDDYVERSNVLSLNAQGGIEEVGKIQANVNYKVWSRMSYFLGGSRERQPKS